MRLETSHSYTERTQRQQRIYTGGPVYFCVSAIFHATAPYNLTLYNAINWSILPAVHTLLELKA